ncbi:MAG: VWA domain-containing protein [Eubacterium sp.]|nr:VWA domain-containing protein [Eubacterium sp.]
MENRTEKKNKKTAKCLSIVLMFLFLCFSSFASYASEDRGEPVNITDEVSELYRIEQIRTVAPYTRAFVYPDDSFGTNIQVNGYLDGIKLNLVSVDTWASIGMGIDYYFLIDLSDCIDEEDFENVKDDLVRMASSLGGKDTLTVYVVGDKRTVRKADRLYSSQVDELQQIINDIDRKGQNVNIYKAVDTIVSHILSEDNRKVFQETENIEEGLGLGDNRKVIVLISDGDDESVNDGQKDRTLETLKNRNIPLYLIQLRDQEKKGLVRLNEIKKIVTESGGEVFPVSEDEEENPIDNLRLELNSCYVVTFVSKNNKISKTPIPFNLEYGFSGSSEPYKTFNDKDVLIYKHMMDSSKPTVQRVKISNDHTVRIEYSELISESARDVSLYSMTDDMGNTYFPTGADYSVDGKNIVILTFPHRFYNGKFKLSILSGITDDTEEKNGLEAVTREMMFYGGEDYIAEGKSFFVRYRIRFIIAGVLLASFILVTIWNEAGKVSDD